MWQALPPSWQSQVTALLHGERGERRPRALRAGVDAGGEARPHPRREAGIHPRSPHAGGGGLKDRAKTEAFLHATAALLKTLSGSELADRDAMRTLDVEKFLAGTGAELMAAGRRAGHPAPGDAGRPSRHPRVRSGWISSAWKDVAVLRRDASTARLRIVLRGGKSQRRTGSSRGTSGCPRRWRMPGRRDRRARARSWRMPRPPRRSGSRPCSCSSGCGRRPRCRPRHAHRREFQAAAGAALGTMLGAAWPRRRAPAGPAVAGPLLRSSGPALTQPGPDTLLHAHAIAVQEARRHIGASVHVVAMDGDEFDGNAAGRRRAHATRWSGSPRGNDDARHGGGGRARPSGLE
jgi:hypothetical protein